MKHDLISVFFSGFLKAQSILISAPIQLCASRVMLIHYEYANRELYGRCGIMRCYYCVSLHICFGLWRWRDPMQIFMTCGFDDRGFLDETIEVLGSFSGEKIVVKAAETCKILRKTSRCPPLLCVRFSRPFFLGV
ncbi:hypothetical protein BS78_06G011800 [Paspalum vaginatum]|nr:hypothetical protein BS78_06G011800 [Paspalum vaginatum]